MASEGMEAALLCGLTAVALGYLEAATVALLRQALHIPNGGSNVLALERLTGEILRREQWRRCCSFIVLLAVSVAGAHSLQQALLLLGWTASLWTLASYGWLRLLVHWPRSLAAFDIYLLPRPWLAPIWIPLGVSLLIALGCAGALLWRVL